MRLRHLISRRNTRSVRASLQLDYRHYAELTKWQQYMLQQPVIDLLLGADTAMLEQSGGNCGQDTLRFSPAKSPRPPLPRPPLSAVALALALALHSSMNLFFPLFEPQLKPLASAAEAWPWQQTWRHHPWHRQRQRHWQMLLPQTRWDGGHASCPCSSHQRRS